MALLPESATAATHRLRGPLVAVAVTLVVAVGYLAGPSSLRLVLPTLLCVAATVACARVWRQQPILPRAWASLTVAMAIFGAQQLAAAAGAPNSVASAILGAAYLPAAYTCWVLAPRGRPSRTAAPFDVTLILGAAGVVTWQLFLAPYLSGRATHGGLVAAVEPVISLALLPLMVRSLISGSRRVPAYSLLLMSAIFSLMASVVLAFVSLRNTIDVTDRRMLLPVLAQLLVLLAALHPRAASLAPPSATERRHVMQTVWLAPVGVGLVTLPWVAHLLDVPPELTVTSMAAAVMVLLLVGRCVVVVVQAQRRAATDSLTGLASRGTFSARLAEAAATAEGAAVLFVDLDDFKNINDARGHDAGDALLIEVGRRLRGVIRPGDLAARIGGDEFAILLESLPAGTTAQMVGDRVAAALAGPLGADGQRLSISASIGVVPPLPGLDGEALLTAADIAMYAAKAADPDKGRVLVYTEALRQQVHGRRTLAAELLQEISCSPLSTLELFYQPVVSLQSGQVQTVEALVRWRHPTRGLLVAGAFLPLIETADAARTLDTYVLSEALRQVAHWRRDGGPLGDVKVAVNLSRSSMMRPDLVELVTGTLARAAVPAQSLVLEITEHENIPEEPGVASALHALADAGVQIALDDFGVGYTSLHYLERFPVHVLKVDKSFTSVSQTDARVALLRGVTALCASVGVTPLAEGIETQEQAALMRSCGFPLAQGYLYSAALPPQELRAWLDRTEAPMAALAGPAAAPSPRAF